MKHILKLGTLVVLLLIAALPAVGQTTGTISGTVTDNTGAVLPAAAITAKSKATNEERHAKSNAAGEFSFAFLLPGAYEVTFSHDGFATMVRTVTLNVTDHLALNASMSAAAVSQVVQVNSDQPLLQTETPTLGRVVDGTAIKELPLANRNFTQLLALSPGTSAPLNDATALGRATQNISTNGVRTGSNAIYIDGMDAINVHINAAANNAFAGNGVPTPSPDAIQEFKVQTSLYDAQYGRSAGANVDLITRTGAAKFHGSLFEFFRNDALNANSYFQNATGRPRPVLRQNQFGGAIGGPILPSKLFFFFSYQGTRQTNGYSGSTSVVLPNIPATRTAATLGAIYGGQAGIFGGTKVTPSGSNINPVALALLNLKNPDGSFVIPSPQITGTTGVNYSLSVPATFNEDQYVGNLDYQIGNRDHIAFKSIIAQQPQFIAFPAANVPGFGTTQQFATRIFSITETHIFTPSLVNEFQGGITRLIGSTGFQNLIPLSSIGMNRFNSGRFPDIPQISLTGSFSLGYSTNADQADTDNTWQYSDTVSWTRGKHEVRGGVQLQRYQDNYFSNADTRGTISFRTFPDFLLGLPGGPSGNGSSYSNIYSEVVANGVNNRNDRITDFEAFAEDTWNITPRFTLNYGLRWDNIGLPVDRYGRDGGFLLADYQAPPPGGSTSVGFVQQSNARNPVPGIPKVSPTLVNTNAHKNFAPRVGFSYSLASNLVLRGGYGLYYDRVSNQLGLEEALGVPNYVRASYTGAANSLATFQTPFPTLPTTYPFVPVIYAPPYTNAHPALALNDVSPQFGTPHVQQWALNLQTQISHTAVFELGYVGSKGSHLADDALPNQAILASPTAPINGQTTNTASNAQLRVPYLGFSPDGITYQETQASSFYNSLQASLTKSLSHGLSFLASYTFSRSLDNTSGSTTGATFSGYDGDQTNINANYGPSNFDRTNRFVLSFDYEAPTIRGRMAESRLMRAALNGWETSGVVVAQSGLPFSILDGNGAAFYGTGTSHASFAPNADINTAYKSRRTESRLTAYFNTSAFVSAGNYFGNTTRSILRGPSQENIDLAVMRNAHLERALSMQFRAEAFNLFNHPNFNLPGSDIASSTFGKITSTVGNPRVLQLALKFQF